MLDQERIEKLVEARNHYREEKDKLQARIKTSDRLMARKRDQLASEIVERKRIQTKLNQAIEILRNGEYSAICSKCEHNHGIAHNFIITLKDPEDADLSEV